MSAATVVLVPGLRGHVEDHWQTRLAASMPGARMVTPLGRTNAALQARVTLLDQVVEEVAGPVILVAHSAGVLVTAHWAARYSPRGWSARSWPPRPRSRTSFPRSTPPSTSCGPMAGCRFPVTRCRSPASSQ